MIQILLVPESPNFSLSGNMRNAGEYNGHNKQVQQCTEAHTFSVLLQTMHNRIVPMRKSLALDPTPDQRVS